MLGCSSVLESLLNMHKVPSFVSPLKRKEGTFFLILCLCMGLNPAISHHSKKGLFFLYLYQILHPGTQCTKLMPCHRATSSVLTLPPPFFPICSQLASNSKFSTLSFPSTRITGMCHHQQLILRQLSHFSQALGVKLLLCVTLGQLSTLSELWLLFSAVQFL